MSVDRARWRNLSDLYVSGRVVELAEGIQVWLQALNTFEQEECRTAARTARARAVAALNHPDSEEMAAAKATYLANGRSAAIELLVGERYAEFLLQVQNRLEADKEWTDRLLLVNGASELTMEASEEEQAAVEAASADYVKALTEGIQDASDHAKAVYEALSDEALEQEIARRYADRRGNEAASAEYALHELWLAARICEAVDLGDGQWEHKIPAEERIRIWDSKEEVRALPRDLVTRLTAELQQLNVSFREGKGSGARGSSSASSPRSRPAEDSTPSTPDETPSEVPGTSTSP